MNKPVPPLILSDSNFSTNNSINNQSEKLTLETSVIETNDFADIDITTKQGIIIITGVSLNLGEFSTILVNNPFTHENSIIFTSVSANTSYGLLTSTFDILENSFYIRVENVGVSVLSGDTIRISYMIVN